MGKISFYKYEYLSVYSEGSGFYKLTQLVEPRAIASNVVPCNGYERKIAISQSADCMNSR